MQNRNVPKATLQRYPVYLKALRKLQKNGVERIMSKELSSFVDIEPTTIRRDFSFLGNLGKQGYGYDVDKLIERFNRTFRTDFLNAYLFENIKEMKNYTEIWMWMYNNERPHSSLQYLSPRNFLLKYGKVKNPNDFPTFQINQNNNTII